MKEQVKSARRILVRCPNWVGDVVMATPVYACIRQNFPDAEIAGWIRSYSRGVVDDGPWFDQVIAGEDRSLRGLFAAGRKIREFSPDLALLLPNSTRSFISAWLGGAGQIYGYRRNFRKLFLSGGPEPIYEQGIVKPLPMLDYYLELCRWLELELPEKLKPELFIAESLQQQANQLFGRYGISTDDLVIGLNPGAKFGSSKCWPTASFAALAELLEKELKAKILLLVGPGEDGIAGEIVEKSSATVINTGPDQIDLTLLKPVVKRCDLLITNDTGPRHYAVAFDRPVVVLVGPTNPVYTASNLDRTVVLREDLECSPCHLKSCPTDHCCMTAITPEQVIAEAKKLL